MIWECSCAISAGKGVMSGSSGGSVTPSCDEFRLVPQWPAPKRGRIRYGRHEKPLKMGGTEGRDSRVGAWLHLVCGRCCCHDLG